MKGLLPLAASLALGVIPAQAAKRDFTDYAGSYKNRCTINYAGTLITSSDMDFTVDVGKNGREAKFKIVGFGDVAANGTAQKIALLGNFKLTPRRVVADNALLAFYVRLPAVGSLKGTTKRSRFALVSTIPGIGTFSMSYILRFHGKKLLVTGYGASPAGAISVSYAAVRKHR